MNTGKQRIVEALRQQLLQNSASLVADEESNVLGSALRRLFPGLKQAFVLNCVPEQGEDIYWVLVSSTEIAEIEISRGTYAENSHPPLLKMIALDAYRKKRHSRDVRQRLEMGLELIKSS
jgi:hypothetical protein